MRGKECSQQGTRAREQRQKFLLFFYKWAWGYRDAEVSRILSEYAFFPHIRVIFKKINARNISYMAVLDFLKMP
jgi:hypothetical protein